eukprot:jgi/Tetstr1/455531/TSEL_042354.t1
MKSLWSKAEASGTSSWLNRVADDAALKIRQQKDALLQKASLPAGLAAVEVREKPAGDQPSGGEVPSVKEPPKKDQQYLRLPVESAKKLRFYDKADLDALIRAQAKEKETLYGTVNALRQILESRHPGASSWMDAEVEQLLADKACINAYDDGVNATLLVSAQAEMDRLRAEERATPGKAPPQLRTRTELRLLVESGWGEEEVVMVEILAEGTPVEEEEEEEDLGLLGTPTRDDGRAELEGRVTQLTAQLKEENARSATMLAKLTRLEEEKRKLIDSLGSQELAAVKSMSPIKDRVAALRGDLEAAEEAGARAAEEARTLKAQLRQQEEEAEKKLTELRGKVSQAAQQQSEMLRRAQDICLEAEERADTAEQKTNKAEARVTKIEGEMRELRARIRELEKENKRLEKEREKAAARAEHAANMSTEAAMKGHVEAQAGATVRSQMASIRRAAEEREAELRRALAAKEAAAEEALHRAKDRIAELEEEVTGLTSAVSRTEAEMDTLERRLREAEEREAALAADLREAEAVVAERDMLAVRVNALEEKLNENRAERAQIDQYKQVARELEAARARAEDELMATARMLTSLESRLRSSNREVEQSKLAMETAEKRCLEVERRVEDEVRARVAAAGADRAQWPAEARAEVGRLEEKVGAVQGVLGTLEEQLASESKARASDARHASLLRQRVGELETAAMRSEREAGDRLRALERDLRAARDEAEECRRIVAEVEEERLALEERARPKQVKGSDGMFRNRGGGSLYGASDEEMAGAGQAEAAREEIRGVDIVYLKNVVLKFIEAAVREDVPQRDALLPAIATLVQATPQEFKALQGVAAEMAGDGTSSGWYNLFGSSSK